LRHNDPADGDRGTERTQRHLGTVLRLMSHHGEAQAHLNKALAIAKTIGDVDGRIHAERELARLASAQDDHSAADKHFDNAERLLRRAHLDRLDEVADLLLDRALTARRRDNGMSSAGWTRANLLAKEALDYFAHAENIRGQGRAYHELGLIAFIQEHWDEAERRLRTAAPLFEHAGDEQALAIVYRALADLCRRTGRQAESDAYSSRSSQLLS
jgi:tetratricopeptide (TPR) repeat protein